MLTNETSDGATGASTWIREAGVITSLSCPNCGPSVSATESYAGPQACPLCCATLRPYDPTYTRFGPPRPRRKDKPRFRMALAPSSNAPYVARRTLETLAWELDAREMEDARLVLSELVANAVTHGAVDGGQTSVAAWLSSKLLLIEVGDRGPGFDRPSADRAPGARPALGLRVVDHLVERWGVTSGPATTVWCELPRGDPQADARSTILV